MSKKIAVFASGWAVQILSPFLTGLSNALKNSSIDTYLFMCHPSWTSTEKERHGEFNIFRLPHLEDFDIAIVISNGLEFNNEIDFLFDKCRKAGIPSITIGIKADGFYYLGVDNETGMRELCSHLVDFHHVKNVMFLAGSKENPDSNLRLKVLEEVCQKNNIPFSREENLFYTNWENHTVTEYIDAWCEAKKPLPDVFVCANDGIALNVCLSLKKYGFSVPKDTLVTGFDNISDAKVFDPAISSVNQNYETIGFESGKLSIDVLNGVKREKEIIIPCKFIVNESCCETKADESNLFRRKMCCTFYANKSEDTILDRKLNQIERVILTGKKYEDIRQNTILTFENEFKDLGDSFHIILEQSYALSINNTSFPLRTDGYSSALEIAYSREKGVVSKANIFNARNLIPDHIPDKNEHLYVFLPLHDDEYSFGYFIMCDCIEKIDSHYIQKYQQRLNITLERYRQKLALNEVNRRLIEINRIDPLTQVKNRMAYEARAKELDSEIQSESAPAFGIAMFDVNNLKKINDGLGHNSGDIYIINACRLICRAFAHSPVFRIGGDEFLAILQNDDLLNKAKILSQMKKTMKELAKSNNSEEEKVSIASGIAVYSSKMDESVQDVVNRADAIMYKNKAAMKGSKGR